LFVGYLEDQSYFFEQTIHKFKFSNLM